MSAIWLDLRRTARSFARRPGYVVATVVSIAVGIGSTTGVYAWLDNLILRPLPLVPGIDRVVAFNGAAADGTTGGAPRTSYPAFLDWQAGLGGVATLAVTAPMRLILRGDATGVAEMAWGLLVSEEYFSLLGVPASRGRTLSEQDNHAQRPVAVISDGFWRLRLAGDPGAIGRRLWLNGADFTVVGVMPPRFTGHDVGYAFDFWLPLSLQPLLGPSGNLLDNAKARWLSGIARLRPGRTFAAADQRLREVAARTSEARGERPVSSAAFVPLREWRAGSVFGPLLSALLAVAGLVLLLCCANVAGLAAATHLAATRETAVRLSVGARRWDVTRLFVIESALLTLAGAGFGLLLALGFRSILPAMVPPTPLPVRLDMTFTWRIAAMGLGATVVTLVLAGLTPAFRASRLDPLAVMRGATPPPGSRHHWIQQALVVIQVAVASVALVVALFFLASLRASARIDPGFSNPEEVLLLGLDFNASGLDSTQGLEALDRVLTAIRAKPGVRSAAAATMVPLGAGGHRFAPTSVEGYDPPPDTDMNIEVSHVSSAYFETMEIQVLRGRSFNDQDRGGASAVAIVNQAFVDKFWPGQEAIGRRIGQGRGWATVVGVTRNGHYDNLSEAAKPIVFQSLRQWYVPTVTVHVRTSADPRSHAQPLRELITALDGSLVPLDPRTLAEHASVSTFAPRIGAIALGIFSTLALGVSLVGLYGIMGFTARRERMDTAIRLALGATPRQVKCRVVWRAVKLSGVGIAIGLGGAFAFVTRIADRLPGTQPTDVSAYLAVAALGAITAAGAAYLPARGAARQSTVSVMREGA